MFQSYSICFPSLETAAEHTLAQRSFGPHALYYIDSYPSASSAVYMTDDGVKTLIFPPCDEPTVQTVADAVPYALAFGSLLIAAYCVRALRSVLR